MIRIYKKGIQKMCIAQTPQTFQFDGKQLVITRYMRWDLKIECHLVLTFIEYMMCLLCYNNDVYMSFSRKFSIVIQTFLFLYKGFFKGSLIK